MSTTEITTEAEAIEPVAPFVPSDDFTVESDSLESLSTQAKNLVKRYARGVVTVETLVYHIAQVVLAARKLHVAPIAKGKTQGKGFRLPDTPEVPDWGGASPEYKLWYQANVEKIAHDAIIAAGGDEEMFESSFKRRLTYRVQTLRAQYAQDPDNGMIPLSDLTVINLDPRTQAQKQAETAAERNRNETPPVASPLFSEEVAKNPEVPIYAVASAVGLALSALDERLTPEAVETMAGGERDNLVKLLGQCAGVIDVLTERVKSAAEVPAAA